MGSSEIFVVLDRVVSARPSSLGLGTLPPVRSLVLLVARSNRLFELGPQSGVFGV